MHNINSDFITYKCRITTLCLSDLPLLHSLYTGVTKNGVLTHIIMQEFIRIKPASLTVSSSFTYNSLWKYKMSRWMKRLATTNAIHTTCAIIHHEMIPIISFKMATLHWSSNRGSLQAGS